MDDDYQVTCDINNHGPNRIIMGMTIGHEGPGCVISLSGTPCAPHLTITMAGLPHGHEKEFLSFLADCLSAIDPDDDGPDEDRQE